MIKNMAWNIFKNTGSIDSFMEFKQIENIEKNMNSFNLVNSIEANNIENKVNIDGNSKNKWDNNF